MTTSLLQVRMILGWYSQGYFTALSKIDMPEMVTGDEDLF